jgi:hypothetical protein
MNGSTKTADAKGRITIGSEYAQKTFLLEKNGETTIILRLAEVVPTREAWLWKNEHAFNQVKQGIRDAQEGKTKIIDLKKHEG